MNTQIEKRSNNETLDNEPLRRHISENNQQLNNLAERAVSVDEFVRNACAILNVPKRDLEQLISAPIGYLDDIEAGRPPTATFIRELSKSLGLSERATQNLTNVRQSDLLIPSQTTLVRHNIAAERLGEDVQELISLLHKAKSPQESVPPELIERAAERVIETGQKLAAPIRLPRTEDMEVRLASIGQLERLDEYRGNLTLFIGVATCAFGGILGICVNWVTQQPIRPTSASVVALALLFLVFTLFAFLARRESNRALAVRDQILGKTSTDQKGTLNLVRYDSNDTSGSMRN